MATETRWQIRTQAPRPVRSLTSPLARGTAYDTGPQMRDVEMIFRDQPSAMRKAQALVESGRANICYVDAVEVEV